MALTATRPTSQANPSTKRPAGARALDRRIVTYSRSAQRSLYGAVLANFLGTALVIIQAILLSQVIAGVFLEGQRLADVSGLLLGILALALVRAGLVWRGEVAAQRAGAQLKTALLSDLLAHFDRSGPLRLQRQQSGELVSIATAGLDDIGEFVRVYQPLRVLAVLVPAMVVLVVLVLDPLSAAVLLATGPVLVLLLALIGSRTKDIAERRLNELTWLSAYFLDLLHGLPTLKMFGRSGEQVETTTLMSRQFGATSLHVLRTAFETSFVLELSATVATAMVAVETGLRLAHGSMAFETALAVLLVTPEFFLPLRQLSARYHAGAAGKAAAEKVFALLDTDVPDESVPAVAQVRPSSLGRGIVRLEGGIRFSSVTIRYSDERMPALHDACFTLRPGTTTALVGATGAGKSTVSNLLLRFVDPEEGSVYVDGVDLTSIDKAAWRELVAWVPQHVHVFAGTIAANIRLGEPEASMDEVVAAAEAAGAHAFIAKLPDGYETALHEHGANLSGGQRQRLGIARAFLKDAPLLILDEPTSHLDTRTETELLASIQRLAANRTTLLISHRIDLVRSADAIIVLDRGEVAAVGTHDELVACSLFYERFALSGAEGTA